MAIRLLIEQVDHEQWREIAAKTYRAWAAAELPGNLMEFKTFHPAKSFGFLYLHFFIDHQNSPRVRAHVEGHRKYYLGEMRLEHFKR